MDIYAKIKRLREDRGMSQEALAQQTGYTDRSSIAKVEKGLVSLSAEEIALFADEWNFTTGETVDKVRREIDRLRKKL